MSFIDVKINCPQFYTKIEQKMIHSKDGEKHIYVPLGCNFYRPDDTCKHCYKYISTLFNENYDYFSLDVITIPPLT